LTKHKLKIKISNPATMFLKIELSTDIIGFILTELLVASVPKSDS